MLPDLSSASARSEAVQELLRDVHAPSTRKAQEMKWRTVVRALEPWSLDPCPPSREAIVALGAALKKGGYASAESYLTLLKTVAERKGFPYTPDLLRLHRDVVRSCTRGAGCPLKPLPLPLLKLGELDLDSEDVWLRDGPLGPGRCMVAGAWFMMREVELACTRACLVRLDPSATPPSVTWSLPASKNDSEAHGVSRTLGCNCDGSPGASCPYHAVEKQLTVLAAKFKDKFVDGRPDRDLPLFPTARGEVVTKDQMAKTVVEAARRLQVPLASPDGSARVTGHSLRVSGAQGLAKAGIDTWAIQLLGRWGSAAVLGYIQDAHLELSASWATRVAVAANVHAKRTADKDINEKLGEANPLQIDVASVGKVVVSGLTEALKDEAAARQVEALEMREACAVKSSTGVYHRVPSHGRLGPMTGWTAACGWRYAMSSSYARAFDALPDNVHYKFLCARCFAERRAALKAA